MPKKYVNPPGLYRHPSFTRIITVERPSKIIYMSGQTPSDDNYQPVHPGSYKGQYLAILDSLTRQLEAVGASWDDVVSRRTYVVDVPAYMEMHRQEKLPVPWSRENPSCSTMIGVTALSNP